MAIKKTKTIKTATPAKQYVAIPYQLCPKCNGYPQQVSNVVIGQSVTTYSNGCNICFGRGIIPMFIQEENKSA